MDSRVRGNDGVAVSLRLNFRRSKRYQSSDEFFNQWFLRLGYYTSSTFDLDQALTNTFRIAGKPEQKAAAEL